MVTSYKNPMVDEVVNILTEISDPLPDYLKGQTEYSKLCNSRVILTQGNINYKIFLELIGILESVYDLNTQHTFLHSSCA